MTGRAPKKGPMRLAVDKSAPIRDVDAKDRAALTLARAYADAIDQAAEKSRLGLELLVTLRESGELSPDAQKAIMALRDAVDVQSVLVDLGPKLLAALDALALTTKSRLANRGGMPDAGPATDPAAAALQRLRDARPGRPGVGGAAAVDPATP